MAGQDKIDVQLDLATSGAQKSLESLRSSFNKSFGSMNIDVGKVGGAVGGLASSLFTAKNAAIAAGTAIVSYFASKEVISKAIDEENAINAVAQALARSGEYSKAALTDIQNFADGLQKQTVYSAGEVLNQVALAKAYGATAEQAKLITRASIELAAVTGKTLEEASNLVTRSLSGQAGALAKLSPRIRLLTADQLKAGAAAQVLIEQFGGTAIGKINTFGGALAQSKNVFDDFLTQVGFLITKNPVVIEGIKYMSEVFADLADYLKANRQNIISFVNDGLAKLLNFTPAIAEGLKFLVNTLSVLTKSLALATAGFNTILSAILNFAPIKLLFDGLVIVIGKVAQGLLLLLETLADIPIVADTLKAVGIDAEAVAQGLHSAAEAASNLGDSVNVDKISEGIDKMNDFAFSVVEGTEKLRDGLNKSLDDGVKKAKELAKTVKDLDAKGTVELKVTNNEESVKASINNYQEALELAFGGPKGAKVGGALIQGIATGLKNGKEGARALLSNLAGAAADAFLPGIGQVVTPLIDALSYGPEAVRKMVKDFVGAVPDLVEAIITAIPVVIEEFANQLPVVFEKLAEKSDEIIIALAKAMPKVGIALALQSPRIMIALAKEMPKAALALIGELLRGAGRFIQEIIRGAGSFVQALIDAITGKGSLFGSGGGVSGFFENANDELGRATGFKFASGGKIPNGFPNDSMKANVSSGEYVIDRGLTADLEKYLKKNENGSSTDVLLARIVQLLEKPQTIESSLALDTAQFAKAIFKVNRTNQRT